MPRTAAWIVPGLAVLLAACGEGGGGNTLPEPEPVQLAIVSGDGQGGAPGWPLPQPLVVRATRGGVPAANVAITISASVGTVEPTFATTDAQGLVSVRWTLPAEGDISAARVTARVNVAEGDQVSFSARRLRQDEQDLVLVPGVGPVRMLVYDSGAFNPSFHLDLAFSDSAVLPPFTDPTAWDEVAVFAPGRAPAMATKTWTPGRDTLRVTFPEMIRMPLTIWVVEAPFDSTMKLVQRHLQGVADSWEAQGGIGLRDVRIVDATAFPQAPRFQGSNISSCVDARTAIGADAGRLNAYYLGQARIGEIVPSASYCGDGFMEIYPLAWDRWPYTLAHEIGHGLLGPHHETLPNNVMHFRGEGSTFSPGQLFVAHYWNQSILNTMYNAHPPAQRRPCIVLNPANAGGPCLGTGFVLD